MDKILEEFMWSQKYRPRKIKDVILPKEIRNLVTNNIKDGKSTNFIFDGLTGAGKTTLALAIANEINADVLQINGSSQNGIDVIRHDIPAFCTSVSLDGGRKMVLIDEGDNLTKDAQLALRGTIEKYSKSTTFIITSNHKNRIDPAVIGRFVEVDFRIRKDQEKELKTAMLKRILEIYNEEVGKPEKENISVLAQIVDKFFPNNRKILNTMQTLVESNSLDAGGLTVISSVIFDDLVEYMKTGKWKLMRTWVTENINVTPDDIIEYLWKHGEEKFGISAMPLLILNVEDYQRNISIVRNPTISTVALFTKIMQQVAK